MAVIGGSIESVGLNGRTFSVASDADSNRKVGGFENEVKVAGDGAGYMTKTRMPFMADGLVILIDDDRGDQEFLQDLANLNDFFPMTITYVTGAVYQGVGQITGELQNSSANSTMPISLSGGGLFTRQ